jgi:hypothetical protein
MKQNTLILIGAFASLLSCKNNCQEKSKQSDTSQKIKIVKLYSFDVVALKDDYTKGKIELLNADGTIWKQFQFSDHFSDNDIQPFALKPENSLMVFKVIGRQNGLYAITVNENKNTIKYIKPNLNAFNYETWQTHIVKAFSVEFDETKNPQKSEPSENAKSLLNKSEFFHPVLIKGDWLKIKDDNGNESWIRWRDSFGNLLINFYYDA